MKNQQPIHLALAGLLALATAFGCADDGKDAPAAAGPAGELIVTLAATDALLGAAASYEIEVDGGAVGAPAEATDATEATTAPTDTTDTTAAPAGSTGTTETTGGTTFSAADVASIAAVDAAVTFTDVTPGLRTATARALDASGNAITEVQATVQVTSTAPAAIILSLTLAGVDGVELTIAGMSASNASPRNHDSVNLSATVSGPTTDPVEYSWSDDCGGVFSDAAAEAPSWTNYWYGACTLTLTARQGNLVATQSMPLDVAVRPGSIERVAGNNGCSAGQALWWEPGNSPLIGEDGPAKEARFSTPRGIEVGSNGQVVFAERGAGRVLAIDPETGLLHRLVGTAGGSYGDNDEGTGTAKGYRLYWTYEVEEESDGNWLIGDLWGDRLYRYYPSSGTVVSLNSAMNYYGLAVSADGTAIGNDCGDLDLIDPTDGSTDNFSGLSGFNSNSDGFYTGCSFDLEAAPDGTLYLANRDNHQILRYDTQDAAKPATLVAGRYDGMRGDFADGAPAQATGAEDGGLYAPSGIEVIGNGDIVVAEMGSGIIRRLTENGSGVTEATAIVRPGQNYVLGEPGPSDGPLDAPWDVAADADGNLYVTEKVICRVSKVHEAL